MDPGAALARLLAGNLRFVAGQPRAGVSGAQRTGLVEAQAPFACVLGCAASRVPPEIIFDTGPGELFVVRVAGNVTSREISASVEYAVGELGVRLVLVLGHQNCGVMQATLAGTEHSGNIGELLEALRPRLGHVEGEGDDRVRAAAWLNARLAAEALRQDEPILATAAREGRLEVVPAYYRLDEGRVEILGPS